jgi:hypothetical protein
MGTIFVTYFMSLDGVISSPETFAGEDFGGDDLNAVIERLDQSHEVFVIGRRQYDEWWWEEATDSSMSSRRRISTRSRSSRSARAYRASSSKCASSTGPPDFGAVAQAAQRHGAEILGPPPAILLGPTG